jgi:hypothetical protein
MCLPCAVVVESSWHFPLSRQAGVGKTAGRPPPRHSLRELNFLAAASSSRRHTLTTFTATRPRWRSHPPFSFRRQCPRPRNRRANAAARRSRRDDEGEDEPPRDSERDERPRRDRENGRRPDQNGRKPQADDLPADDSRLKLFQNAFSANCKLPPTSRPRACARCRSKSRTRRCPSSSAWRGRRSRSRSRA